MPNEHGIHSFNVTVGFSGQKKSGLQGRAGNKSVPKTFPPLCAPANRQTVQHWF